MSRETGVPFVLTLRQVGAILLKLKQHTQKGNKMKKAILAVAIGFTAITAQARDIAMREEHLCYAVFNHFEYIGKQKNDRELARAGYNLKVALRQKYQMDVDGIIQGKSDLNSYTGPGKSMDAWKALVKKCQSKV